MVEMAELGAELLERSIEAKVEARKLSLARRVAAYEQAGTRLIDYFFLRLDERVGKLNSEARTRVAVDIATTRAKQALERRKPAPVLEKELRAKYTDKVFEQLRDGLLKLVDEACDREAKAWAGEMECGSSSS